MCLRKVVTLQQIISSGFHSALLLLITILASHILTLCLGICVHVCACVPTRACMRACVRALSENQTRLKAFDENVLVKNG